MFFGFFFLGEYVSIWTVCCLNIILFWGGFLTVFDYQSIILYSLKVIAMVVTFIWVRGSVPRYRYDQLMRLGWKILLPISLGFVILYAGIYYELLYLKLEEFFWKENMFAYDIISNVKDDSIFENSENIKFSDQEILTIVKEAYNFKGLSLEDELMILNATIEVEELIDILRKAGELK